MNLQVCCCNQRIYGSCEPKITLLLPGISNLQIFHIKLQNEPLQPYTKMYINDLKINSQKY